MGKREAGVQKMLDQPIAGVVMWQRAEGTDE
jgi:hypothetical protein